MVAPGVFSKMTLNDNWFEDRMQPADSLSATGAFHKKAPRAPEPDLAYIGERYDVLARIGRMPPRPSYATPDDGFKERTTTNRSDFVDFRGHSSFGAKKHSAPSLINLANAPVTGPERRPLDGPESGFGAALDRHPRSHDARFWDTTHGDYYGYAEPGAKLRAPRVEPSTKLLPAGVSTEHEEGRAQGMKCGQLCGEAYCDSHDPGRDTRTQRAWLQGGDAALTNIHLGGTRRVPPREDNELSLPLGNGAMSKIRADLKERQGRLYRTATTITKGAHLRAGLSVFQDYDG